MTAKYKLSGLVMGSLILLAACQSPETVIEPEAPVQEVTPELVAEVEAFEDQAQRLAKLELVSVEIADELYNTDEVLRAWVDEQKAVPGLYVNTIGDYTYLLAAAGKKDTTGYGMGYIDSRRDDVGLYVVYTVIEPMLTEGETIETTESYPFMVLRLPETNEEVRGIFVEERDIASYLTALNPVSTESDSDNQDDAESDSTEETPENESLE